MPCPAPPSLTTPCHAWPCPAQSSKPCPTQPGPTLPFPTVPDPDGPCRDFQSHAPPRHTKPSLTKPSPAAPGPAEPHCAEPRPALPDHAASSKPCPAEPGQAGPSRAVPCPAKPCPAKPRRGLSAFDALHSEPPERSACLRSPVAKPDLPAGDVQPFEQLRFVDQFFIGVKLERARPGHVEPCPRAHNPTALYDNRHRELRCPAKLIEGCAVLLLVRNRTTCSAPPTRPDLALPAFAFLRRLRCRPG